MVHRLQKTISICRQKLIHLEKLVLSSQMKLTLIPEECKVNQQVGYI